MNQVIRSIPRPLVRANQWFIVLSVILTWITGQEWILALPLLFGLSGLLFNINPIITIGKLFLRKDLSEYIPEDYAQQQFNQVISVVCLALGLVGYLTGYVLLATIFTTMVALAAFIAIVGFCVGCFIRYQWLQFLHKKSI
ncbi:DUF4395 domain-containing protein [Cytobacillus suaedae]|nr:DUF4395 domain-containing protein [Cytobacillus suaedae]